MVTMLTMTVMMMVIYIEMIMMTVTMMMVEVTMMMMMMVKTMPMTTTMMKEPHFDTKTRPVGVRLTRSRLSLGHLMWHWAEVGDVRHVAKT